MDIKTILDEAPQNLTIFDSLLITDNKLKRYHNIMCSISGGADSDIVLDICVKVDRDNKVKYVFFDTGLEYEATKKHLKYLEDKYNIKIEVEKAVKPIPLCCRKYGQPFLSKQVSEFISRLQRHNFKWEDRPYEELIKEYPKCKSALKWWCNEKGGQGVFNISRNKHLKEFMIENPPTFLISNKCCTYAKKLVANRYKEDNNIDLSITGIRKAEGGSRATAYKNCFTSNSEKGKADEYRAVFWYKNADKEEYEGHYNIVHSECYSKYGMSRTGCAGCPFGRDFETELDIIQKYEPKLYKAVNKIFGDSYEYTRKYRRFVDDRKKVSQ
jgi:3'-phosphoadenosine 5'-phosphosulfate sulfotransferase (PAPS reductase)/FAD synthetase